MLMDTSIIIKNSKPKLNRSQVKIKNLSDALKTFLNGETGKFGNYFATKNALVYRTLSTVDDFNQDVLVLRLIRSGKVHYLANASRLNYCESKISFGERHAKRWGGETQTQQYLRECGFPMLPFSSFTQAGLKISDAEILDQTGSETVIEKTLDHNDKEKMIERHFTGASLFLIGGKCFLFDIDREEIKHGLFNPFICELPSKVNSIVEAYDILKPLEVRTAEIEGKEVLRQGEYFFIKVAEQDAYKPDAGQADWNFRENNESSFKTARLSAQGNRPHLVSFFNEDAGLVSGEVLHTGREHKNLVLKGWFKPVPNTATRAFTLRGDVD